MASHVRTERTLTHHYRTALKFLRALVAAEEAPPELAFGFGLLHLA